MFAKALLKKSNIKYLSTSAIKLLKEGEKVSLVKRILERDVIAYSDLVNDQNPVHLPENKETVGIVHGTYLLGLVSGLIATTSPGPGTVVTAIEARFLNSCPYPSTVEVTVELGRVRKITKVSFLIENKDSKDVILKGEASCLLQKEQLATREQ